MFCHVEHPFETMLNMFNIDPTGSPARAQMLYGTFYRSRWSFSMTSRIA